MAINSFFMYADEIDKKIAQLSYIDETFVKKENFCEENGIYKKLFINGKGVLKNGKADRLHVNGSVCIDKGTIAILYINGKGNLIEVKVPQELVVDGRLDTEKCSIHNLYLCTEYSVLKDTVIASLVVKQQEDKKTVIVLDNTSIESVHCDPAWCELKKASEIQGKGSITSSD